MKTTCVLCVLCGGLFSTKDITWIFGRCYCEECIMDVLTEDDVLEDD